MGNKIQTVEVWIDRINQGPDVGKYLATIAIGTAFRGIRGTRAAFPQNIAVVDDFGTLIFLRGWQ